jgi:hypothetical protein
VTDGHGCCVYALVKRITTALGLASSDRAPIRATPHSAADRRSRRRFDAMTDILSSVTQSDTTCADATLRRPMTAR